jgi:hypothetical protein
MPIGIYWPAPVLQEQKKYAKFLCISMTSTPSKGGGHWVQKQKQLVKMK